MENKRKIKVSTKLSEIIRSECANYYEGNCLIHECPCVQINSAYSLEEGKVLCKYCLSVLLATHPEIARAIETGSKSARCQSCGTVFFPRHGNHVYCDDCSVLRRKQKEAARQREIYQQKKQQTKPQ